MRQNTPLRTRTAALAGPKYLLLPGIYFSLSLVASLSQGQVHVPPGKRGQHFMGCCRGQYGREPGAYG